MHNQDQDSIEETSAIKSFKKLKTKVLQSFHINYNLKWENLQMNIS